MLHEHPSRKRKEEGERKNRASRGTQVLLPCCSAVRSCAIAGAHLSTAPFSLALATHHQGLRAREMCAKA